MKIDEQGVPSVEDPFNVDEHYKLYLYLIGASEEVMNEHQKIEMRKAFVAGFSQCFLLMGKEIHQIPQPVSELGLMQLEEQIMKFWKKETIRDNPDIN